VEDFSDLQKNFLFFQRDFSDKALIPFFRANPFFLASLIVDEYLLIFPAGCTCAAGCFLEAVAEKARAFSAYGLFCNVQKTAVGRMGKGRQAVPINSAGGCRNDGHATLRSLHFVSLTCPSYLCSLLQVHL
jgi:hypothetical protein